MELRVEKNLPRSHQDTKEHCYSTTMRLRARLNLAFQSANQNLESSRMTTELSKLRELLSATLVEVEIAIDTATYPDWTETKENLLRAIDIVRKLERDQTWSKLSKKK